MVLLLNLPYEVLIKVFSSTILDSNDIKEVKNADPRFAELINDPYFWWKKSVDEGYTTMPFSRFKMKVENIAPLSEETSICTFNPDSPNPEAVYRDQICFTVGVRKCIVDDKMDRDYIVSSIKFCINQLNLTVAHGGHKSIYHVIGMIKALNPAEDIDVDISDAYIIAAKRTRLIFDQLVREFVNKGYGKRYSIVYKRTKVMEALRDVCSLSSDDIETIKNFISLLIMTYGDSPYSYKIEDISATKILQFDPTNPIQFSKSVTSVIEEIKMFNWGGV